MIRSTFPALLAALALSGCHPEKPEKAGQKTSPPQAVEVTRPEQATLRDLLSLPGSLEPNESAEVRAEVTGLLREIRFTDGQEVKKDEVLATIDDRELQAQLAETEAQLVLARQNFERNQRLVATNSIAQAEVDAAAAEAAQLEAAKRLLEVRLSKTSITAPFDGTLGARLLSPGDLIDPTQPLATLTDASRLKVTFAVPERYYERLRIGGEVLISNRPGEKKVATVHFISSTVDSNTRAATVSAWLEDPPPELRPGMFTPVQLVLDTHEDALVVPEAALLASTRGDIVIAVDPARDGGPPTARFVPVRTGLRELGRVEVTPLEEGALGPETDIVAAGVGALVITPGSPLAPQEMQIPPTRTGSRLDAGQRESD